MTDNRIPWWEPELGEDVRVKLLETFDGGFINDGDVTRALEARLAGLIGVEHGIAASSCTAALALSLIALDIGPGDEVLVPDLTFIATANAVKLAGGDVRLVDVDAERLTIDPEKAAAAIGPKTKAMIAVDFNGRGCDYAALEALCEDHGMALICDSAQALGSRYKGQILGSFGAVGCFSFSANKMFFGGQGGAAVTSDETLHARLLELRNHGRHGGGSGGREVHHAVGFNFKYPNLLAALVLEQLEQIDRRLDHARQRQTWYRELLDGCPGLSFPRADGDDEAILWSDVLVENRERVSVALSEAGVGHRAIYAPLHQQQPYKGEDRDFPNATAISEQALWLPSALSLTRDQAARVADTVRAVLEG
jgi:perosamine synthetase